MFVVGERRRGGDSKRDVRAAHKKGRRERREIARRRAQPGWRAAVLDERASRHALSSASERGRQRLPSAGLSERSERCTRSERRRSFLCERRRSRRVPRAIARAAHKIGTWMIAAVWQW